MKKWGWSILLFVLSCHPSNLSKTAGDPNQIVKRPGKEDNAYTKLASRPTPLRQGDTLGDFNLPELVLEQGKFSFRNGPSFYNRLQSPYGLVVFESFSSLDEIALKNFRAFVAGYAGTLEAYFVLTGFAAIRYGMAFKQLHPEWVVLADIDPALAAMADLSKIKLTHPPELLSANQERDVPIGTDMLMMLGLFKEEIVDGMRLLGTNSFLVKKADDKVIKTYNLWGTPFKKIEEHLEVALGK